MTQFVNDLLSALIRLVLIASGIVMAGLVLVLAVTFGAGVLVWSLLTGRRPQFRFRGMDPRATMAGMRTRAHARTHTASRRPPVVDVIDIEAREVKD